MAASTILLVDADPPSRDVIVKALTDVGYSITTVADEVQAFAEAGDHDLVILDILSGPKSAADVCREIRTHSRVPIIMVTAKTSEIDTVVGLEVGADDYVSKPYRLRELVARIRAALRRAPRDQPVPSASVLEVGDVRLEPESHEVFVRGDLVTLPLKEFELLEVLLDNAGRVVTRDSLIDRVWGPHYVGDTKTLDVHVKRLRSKIEEDPSTPRRIVTIRGLGYKYEMSK